MREREVIDRVHWVIGGEGSFRESRFTWPVCCECCSGF